MKQASLGPAVTSSETAHGEAMEKNHRQAVMFFIENLSVFKAKHCTEKSCYLTGEGKMGLRNPCRT